MGDQVRIGAEGVSSQLSQFRHPSDALVEVIFGIGKRIAEIPAFPVGGELLQSAAHHGGVLAGGAVQLFVMARETHYVYSAADSSLRVKYGFAVSIQRAEFLDYIRAMRHRLVRVNVKERRLPLFQL